MTGMRRSLKRRRIAGDKSNMARRSTNKEKGKQQAYTLTGYEK